MKATRARTPWFTNAKDDERSSRREKDEERSLPAASRLHPLPRVPFAKSLRAGRMTAKRGARY
jgi:hypothetical protein